MLSGTLNGLEKGTVIVLASSDTSLERLLQAVRKANDEGAVLQLFNPNKIIDKAHIIGAYLNATAAFEEKRNISKTLAIEMMLYAGMTSQISEAISEVGARSSRSFLLFAKDRASYNRVKEFLKNEKEFSPRKEQVKYVASSYGIAPGDNMDMLILQKIALSRLDE